ncbi:MAG: FABP family protein [Rothia sp. (in: high G+C Gram-positive bacteria)]|nr:FABP family protein [Rothia sp. (in: high G+C Gram-positive bacteria)]
MPIEIPSNLSPELVPFAWLLGSWEGTGSLWYQGEEGTPFGQTITFSQEGLPFLEYRAESFLLDDAGQRLRLLTLETGFWQLDRPQGPEDLGPGLKAADPSPVYADAASVEQLRNADDGFNILVSLSHPGGISETYSGLIKGPVVRMQTANILRDDISKDYAGSVRLWGLVQGDLMWDWEIADKQGKLHKHASAQLRKTRSMTGLDLGQAQPTASENSGQEA